MVRFIIQTLIMALLAFIMYLMARTLPRISDESDNSPDNHSRAMVYIEKMDEFLKVFLEKTLRQIRVWILRLDNLISQKLNRFRKESPKEKKLPSIEEENNKSAS